MLRCDLKPVSYTHLGFKTFFIKSINDKSSSKTKVKNILYGTMIINCLLYTSYLHYEAPEDEQNFAMIMEMLRAGAIEDEEDTRPSPLDELFAELEMSNPDHIALKYYRSYHSGAAKTLKSIQITLAARLEKFNLESLASLTTTDAVSYTHLDVYKRQVWRLRVFFIPKKPTPVKQSSKPASR